MMYVEDVSHIVVSNSKTFETYASCMGMLGPIQIPFTYIYRPISQIL